MQSEHQQVDSSLRSILTISFPLILSALSSNLLYFIDRMILAYYSVNSMNAAAISGNFVAIFSFVFVSIAGISEVYVGQNNGQKNYSNLAIPVWQMIYFALLGLVILFPFGYFAEYINMLPQYCEKEGLEYQQILIPLASVPAIKVALGSFFIGQGKTRIITYSVVTGAITNVILDILFVFGYKSIIPEMGCKGAAIATVISELVQILILSIVFFNSNNRLRYGTLRSFRFNKEIFKGCIKLGYPMATGRIFELLAWHLIYVTISYVSKEQSIIQGICVSIYIFFAFIADGISKSSATISANLIGQKDLNSIRKTLKTFFKLVIVFGAIIAIPLAIFPRSILYFLDMAHDDISALYPSMIIIFKILVINIMLEAFAAALWGVLLSGGDTKYPTVSNLCSLWGLVVLPVALLYYFNLLTSAIVIYGLTTAWGVCISWIFYKRYQTLKWYNLFPKLKH